MHNARRRNQLVGGLAPHVELGAGHRYFERDRPDMNPAKRPTDLGVTEIEVDPSELGQICQLPEDDRRNAPASGSQQPV